ncbi:hypothetical protein N9K47_00475 [bacterium]|nr:hypothetical protein [bacterium]
MSTRDIQVSRLIESLDQDGDGEVDLNELVQVLESDGMEKAYVQRSSVAEEDPEDANVSEDENWSTTLQHNDARSDKVSLQPRAERLHTRAQNGMAGEELLQLVAEARQPLHNKRHNSMSAVRRFTGNTKGRDGNAMQLPRFMQPTWKKDRRQHQRRSRQRQSHRHAAYEYESDDESAELNGSAPEEVDSIDKYKDHATPSESVSQAQVAGSTEEIGAGSADSKYTRPGKDRERREQFDEGANRLDQQARAGSQSSGRNRGRGRGRRTSQRQDHSFLSLLRRGRIDQKIPSIPLNGKRKERGLTDVERSDLQQQELQEEQQRKADWQEELDTKRVSKAAYRAREQQG